VIMRLTALLAPASLLRFRVGQLSHDVPGSSPCSAENPPLFFFIPALSPSFFLSGKMSLLAPIFSSWLDQSPLPVLGMLRRFPFPAAEVGSLALCLGKGQRTVFFRRVRIRLLPSSFPTCVT